MLLKRHARSAKQNCFKKCMQEVVYQATLFYFGLSFATLFGRDYLGYWVESLDCHEHNNNNALVFTMADHFPEVFQAQYSNSASIFKWCTKMHSWYQPKCCQQWLGMLDIVSCLFTFYVQFAWPMQSKQLTFWWIKNEPIYQKWNFAIISITTKATET